MMLHRKASKAFIHKLMVSETTSLFSLLLHPIRLFSHQLEFVFVSIGNHSSPLYHLTTLYINYILMHCYANDTLLYLPVKSTDIKPVYCKNPIDIESE